MKFLVVALVVAISANFSVGELAEIKENARIVVCALTFIREHYKDAAVTETDSTKKFFLQMYMNNAKNLLERLQDAPGAFYRFDKPILTMDVNGLKSRLREEEQANGPQNVIAAYKAAADSLSSLNTAWDEAIGQGTGNQVENEIRTQLATPRLKQDC